MSKRDYEKSAADWAGPQYDSDEDLSPEEQAKIKEKEGKLDFSGADTVRQEAWNNSSPFPKLKKIVKGAYYGDKRNKDNE